ncbi:aldehyde dehydrogenase family protein, partial [Mycolicibacterium gadium]
RRDPLGVVGSVAPWNYPLLMAIWKISPALMTGNTLVLKPSEHTPFSVLRLAELAQDLFPAGVFNIVTGHGSDVGASLVAHPRVRMSSLTGSVATGRALMHASADSNLKRLHLEL